jgi:hypothetical protein
VERFNSRAQAKFWIERAGGRFGEYEAEDDAYRRSLERIRRDLSLGLPMQEMDRGFVPTYLFSRRDVVIAAGQDGLVANTAKYVGAQPLLGVNPDPERFDGVLLPFSPAGAGEGVRRTLEGKAAVREVTLAEATLNDGQRLLAFNDLFLGPRTHTSARYRIRFGDREEFQSSSGIIVSTGAGSTGWLSSLFNMAAGLSAFAGGKPGSPTTLSWEDRRLVFVVREPFVSRHSAATLTAGLIPDGTYLTIESTMPADGVIFSDGIEKDALSFTSGLMARVGVAAQRARLVI